MNPGSTLTVAQPRDGRLNETFLPFTAKVTSLAAALHPMRTRKHDARLPTRCALGTPTPISALHRVEQRTEPRFSAATDR